MGGRNCHCLHLQGPIAQTVLLFVNVEWDMSVQADGGVGSAHLAGVWIYMPGVFSTRVASSTAMPRFASMGLYTEGS